MMTDHGAFTRLLKALGDTVPPGTTLPITYRTYEDHDWIELGELTLDDDTPEDVFDALVQSFKFSAAPQALNYKDQRWTPKKGRTPYRFDLGPSEEWITQEVHDQGEILITPESVTLPDIFPRYILEDFRTILSPQGPNHRLQLSLFKQFELDYKASIKDPFLQKTWNTHRVLRVDTRGPSGLFLVDHNYQTIPLPDTLPWSEGHPTPVYHHHVSSWVHGTVTQQLLHYQHTLHNRPDTLTAWMMTQLGQSLPSLAWNSPVISEWNLSLIEITPPKKISFHPTLSGMTVVSPEGAILGHLITDSWIDPQGFKADALELITHLQEASRPQAVILAGPSGSGKTTLAQVLSPGNKVQTATTRSPRPGESDKDYFFMSPTLFEKTDMLAPTHYDGADYGIPDWEYEQRIQRPLSIFVVDAEGVEPLRKRLAQDEVKTTTIVLTLPKEILERRLWERDGHLDRLSQSLKDLEALEDLPNTHTLNALHSLETLVDEVWELLSPCGILEERRERKTHHDH